MIGDFVVVKTRTGKAEEFQWDGCPVVIDAKKGMRLTREMAEAAISANALKWDKNSGAVVESKVFIDDDIGTPREMPSKAITDAAVREIKKTDGLGGGTILVDGRRVKKMSVNLDPDSVEIAEAS